MYECKFNKLERACDGHPIRQCNENCYIMALEQEVGRLRNVLHGWGPRIALIESMEASHEDQLIKTEEAWNEAFAAASAERVKKTESLHESIKLLIAERDKAAKFAQYQTLKACSEWMRKHLCCHKEEKAADMLRALMPARILHEESEQ